MTKQAVKIYYDGDCPYCRNFVVLSKLKSEYDVNLYNLRESPDKVSEFSRNGYDVNEGIIVTVGDTLYFGADAIYIIGKLSDNTKKTGKLYYFIFSNKAFSHFLYPMLKLGRNLTLLMLGRKKINTRNNENL